MRMKLLLVAMTLLAGGVRAQDLELYRARIFGAEAKEILHVVDQDGKSVSGATIEGSIRSDLQYGKYIPIGGLTDTNGEYVIKGKCADIMRCNIRLDGYYDSVFNLQGYGYRHSLHDGKWHPYGSRNMVVLNRMINPQPMTFHNALKYFNITVLGEWLAFDLEKHDFLPPQGKGVEADMLLRFTRTSWSPSDEHVTMEVSFTNNPYAGAYVLKQNKASMLRSVYHADTNAVYCPTLSYRTDITPGKPPDLSQRLSEDDYLVYRTRTKVDADGRLVSAHYGKIYGEWAFRILTSMRMAVAVFNPQPNDTNLEDLHTFEEAMRAKRYRESIERERPRRAKRRALKALRLKQEQDRKRQETR